MYQERFFSPLSFVGVRVLPEVPLLGKGEAGAVPSADPGPAASPLNHAICCPNPGVHTPVRSQFSVRAVEPALGKQVPTCWRPGPPGGLRGQLLVLWLRGAFSDLGTACACARMWPLLAPLALCSPGPSLRSACHSVRHLFVGLSSDHQIAGSVRHDLPVRNVPRFESCIFSVPHGT